MKVLSGNEIRSSFLKFFEKKNHKIVESSSLIPAKDPTLLFTNAGMVQFKGVFLGEEKVDYKRAASSQKCVRAGGKHNDLENVGYTARHHTFFEMLGNFSFGDYFKLEAIKFAWEFLTVNLGIPEEKLSVSIYKEDDQASEIWNKEIGLSLDRIFRLGEKDNFWAMGDTGPCGPCSEIIYDQGEDTGCKRPNCNIECGCDRFLEIWNLVFMQYNRDSFGNLHPLPAPSIDTGMGLERVCAVIQGVKSNFETDLLKDIIDFASEILEVSYGINSENTSSLNVIADHIRAITFLISDGVVPSNIGRGYVLRRIIRRAMRHGKKLGIKKPFLYRVADAVINKMGDIYKELKTNSGYIKKVITNEEERFIETLDRGLKLLDTEFAKLKEGENLSGKVAFTLYDTYGFPLDLTEDIARGKGISIDKEGFEAEMAYHKNISLGKFKEEKKVKEVYKEILEEFKETRFEGYNTLSLETNILAIVKGEERVNRADVDEEVEIFTESTPFYGEAGGQVGDIGFIEKEGCKVEVTGTERLFNSLILHNCKVINGNIKVGDKVKLSVPSQLREDTARNHTATHILHSALRKVLGSHVKQEGSLVEPKRLRFDFSHFAPLTENELQEIEMLANLKILENLPVETSIMEIEEAKKSGALAFFDEKYGSKVRVVQIDDFSKELCGGTHVKRTGDIGVFKILSESGIASQIRRIEVVTGRNALLYINNIEKELKEVGSIIKANIGEISTKIKNIIQKQKELENELDTVKSKLLTQSSSYLVENAKLINGIKVVTVKLDAKDPKEMRDLSDKLRDKLKSGIVSIASLNKDKVMFLIAVTKDLTHKFNSASIIKEVAPIIEGTGGGKADMAQAGGNKPENIDKAFNKLYEIINNIR